MGSGFLPLIKFGRSLVLKLVKMFSKSCAILLLSAAACSALNTEDVSLYEDQSDPRVFFANYTSSLLAVNTTLLAYAGIIVAAGVVVGLVLYFIATNPQQRYYGNSNAYNSNYYSQSRMLHGASNFLGDFDLLGLVTKGVEIYKQLNEEEELVGGKQDNLSLSVRRLKKR